MSATLELDLDLALGRFRLSTRHRLALGAVTALFGPSGSGKSTLLRLIAGLERRAKGRLAFGSTLWQDSERRVHVPAHRRGVGLVFQDAWLFPHLSVGGNLGYAERRAPRTDRPLSREGVVGALDLAALLERRVQSLSGGERQRVAIGRALLAQPQLLLMDEPLAGLDLKRKGEILPYLERLPATFGIPIIYVTHSIDEVMWLADHLVALNAGRIVAEGPVAATLASLDLKPLAAREEPGAVLEGEVVAGAPPGGLARIAVGSGKLRLPVMSAPAGTRIRLWIAARDVALATRYPEGISIRNIIEGQIATLEAAPDAGLVLVRVAVGSGSLCALITGEAASALALRPGLPVWALIKSAAVTLPPRSASAQSDG